MLSKNRVKELQQLHLKKHRDAARHFIVEGVKSVLEVARERPGILIAVYAVDAFADRHGSEVTAAGASLTVVSEAELSRVSMQQSPNQALAVCRYLDDAPGTTGRQPFTFYLDDIRDPGNLGTILRIADWFGVKKVYCSPDTCELYNPKALQASMGSFLRVGVEYGELAALARTTDLGEIYGADLDGVNIFEAKLGRGVVVIGNEANGMRPETVSMLTQRLTIPSAPGARTESLNAAMAAAIIAAEFYRRNG